MAVLVMQVAWGRVDTGICVDVHVHRISNRLVSIENYLEQLHTYK